MLAIRDRFKNIRRPQVLAWSAVIIALIVLGHFWGHEIPRLERWLAQLGPWGPIVFAMIFCAVAPLGFSITALAIAAGALFGLLKGSIVLILAAFISECLMFFLSRYFFKRQVAAYLQRHARLAALNKAATEQGARFQILLRITPIPYAACCYLLSLSGTTFATYMLGFAGFIPGNFVFVYMGYMAKHATQVAHGISPYSHYQTALMAAGLVVTLLIVAYLTRLARQAFKNIPLQNGSDAYDASHNT